jgi:basic membrane protein A
MPMSYDLTKDAIEDAVALGIDIILLTESWQQSQAVYDAQTKYPEVNFVLFGYEPREHYFYAEPSISENTISIKTSSSITGFLAGYMAVSEGYQHLGFFGSNGSHDFESGIGFVAGAFYAANQYDQDIFFNERSFKIVDHTTLLVSDYFAEGAFDTGTEVIYTPSNENTVIEQVASERERHVILGLNSPTEELDSVLVILKDSQYHTTMDILTNYFSHDFKGGDYMAERSLIDFDISSLNQSKLEAYQTLLDRLYTDDIEVPLNYDELIVFIEDLGMSDSFDLDAYTLETVSMFPFN